ncbi:MAG: ATP-binding protein [Thermodesulfobacteriota bacterium]
MFSGIFLNAINHGDRAGTIVLGFEGHGSMYRLDVYNSGKPIPEGLRDKVFVKFSHVGNNAKENPNGMGLGLYLVRKII